MAIFTVTNLNDAGSGSLRAAIGEANLDISGTPSVISFSVNGTIALASDLPPISHMIQIDATSAPTYTSGGAPVVELDCNSHAGLTFATGSAGSRLLGLAIGHADGNGVTLDAGSITLDKNYIGLNLAGAIFGNSGDGVYVSSNSSNNLIGFNPTAATGVLSNVISGNDGNGISLHGSSGNTLVDNRIGTNPTGSAAISNGGNGIWLTASSNENEIGGTAFVDTSTGAVNDPTGDKGTVSPVFVVPPLGNLISGNSQNGILIDANSQQNVLNGNFVGTTADGNGAIGNTLDGVAINGADNNSLIGCQFVNNPFVYYNVVSANGENGLHITDSDNTTVQANFFGVGADNTTIIGNQANGILVDGTSANTQVGGVIPLGNVAAGNGQNGIEVRDTASGFITFNTFGGLLAFKGAAPNGNDGLLITSTGGNNTAQTNVFSGNLHDGIQLSGDASGVTVDPNILGLNTAGNAVLPNGNDGIEIDGTAHDNVIGGSQSSVIPQNTFSGNAGYGVALLDHSHDNQVLLSYVGLSAGGTAGLGNLLGGVLVGGSAHDNVIGGPSTQSLPTTNLISGNHGNGVTLATGTSDIQVIDNSFGFDRFGAPTLPNSGAAIVVNGSSNPTVSGNTIALPCFAAGTRITTERGETAVESLCVGERVRTMLGKRWEAVKWIGYRRVDCRHHPEPHKVWPVRIAAGTFGLGMPLRDLFLSPDHAVFVYDVLIPVKYLINHRSIEQVVTDEVVYYHIELARHDVLLAEGLPSESYLETGGRSNFADGGEMIRLFADFSTLATDIVDIWEATGCAPLVVTGPVIEIARSLVDEHSDRCGVRLAQAARRKTTRPVTAPRRQYPAAGRGRPKLAAGSQ